MARPRRLEFPSLDAEDVWVDPAADPPAPTGRIKLADLREGLDVARWNLDGAEAVLLNIPPDHPGRARAEWKRDHAKRWVAFLEAELKRRFPRSVP